MKVLSQSLSLNFPRTSNAQNQTRFNWIDRKGSAIIQMALGEVGRRHVIKRHQWQLKRRNRNFTRGFFFLTGKHIKIDYRQRMNARRTKSLCYATKRQRNFDGSSFEMLHILETMPCFATQATRFSYSTCVEAKCEICVCRWLLHQRNSNFNKFYSNLISRLFLFTSAMCFYCSPKKKEG